MPAPQPPSRTSRKSWPEELEIIDRTMRTISGIGDAEAHVDAYWQGISELIEVREFVSLSRRGIAAPDYLITRSSRFTEDINPWTERHRLPRLRGGVLGDVMYAGKPVIIDDLPARLTPDDPGRFYIEGFSRLIAFPQYDTGEALNVTVLLVPPGMELDDRAIPSMHWQNSLFGRGTQNLVLRNQLAAALATLDREMQAVGEIQRSLLPAALPDLQGYDLAAHYQTSARAGGDYYDLFHIDERRVGILVADVSGHGTPAAVLMAIVRALVHARPWAQTGPGEIACHPCKLLTWLNEQLSRSYAHAGTFVTAFVAVLDIATGELHYASAGHNPPRLVPASGPVRELRGPAGLPLGIDATEQYTTATIPLGRGDLLLLYTDGITEAMAPIAAANTDAPTTTRPRARELFGESRLDATLAACQGEHPAACVAGIVAAVDAFTGGATPGDDRTILAIRRK